MRKLRLDMDSLVVETFATVEQRGGALSMSMEDPTPGSFQPDEGCTNINCPPPPPKPQPSASCHTGCASECYPDSCTNVQYCCTM